MHSPLLSETCAAASKPHNIQSQQHHINCRHHHYSNQWHLHKNVHEYIQQFARWPSTSNRSPSTCLWLRPHNLKGFREGAVCSSYTQAKGGTVNLGISCQEQSSRRCNMWSPKHYLPATSLHPCTIDWKHHKMPLKASPSNQSYSDTDRDFSGAQGIAHMDQKKTNHEVSCTYTLVATLRASMFLKTTQQGTRHPTVVSGTSNFPFLKQGSHKHQFISLIHPASLRSQISQLQSP